MKQALFLAAVAAWAADPAAVPLASASTVLAKNFYVLELLDAAPFRAVLASSPALRTAHAAKIAGLAAAGKCGAGDIDCVLAPVRFADAEIAAAGDALRSLCESNSQVRSVVSGPLRASGMYVRSHALEHCPLLAEAWRQSAIGINRAIDIYGAGKAPRYPAIDSISYDLTKPGYGRILQMTAAVLLDDASTMPLFFHPPLRFALLLMDHNHRDEAARHESMHEGENRAALAHLRSIRDWDRYPYSAIVVPGAGNDRPNWPLSAYGKMRLQLAAKRHRDGKAPVIIVSGGYVHPNQTPYAEAIEMKRALERDFGVPANAILIDPHARHTTTNLRNAARLIYRYGVPFAKTALITTDPGQSAYIEAPIFTKRCADELGYQPHQGLKRTSPFDLEFRPAIESLQSDPSDLLDP